MTGCVPSSAVPQPASRRTDLLPAARSSPAAHRAGPLPALRAATRAHHARIDRLVDLRQLRDGQRYGRVLQGLAGFLPPWEAAVGSALPAGWHTWLRLRSRRPFLQQDLRALGLAASAPPATLPLLPTAAAAWGAVYVMEGASLGGQVITRSLAAAGIGPERGAAYFHGWGAATGPMWQEVRSLLDRQLADSDSVAQACGAACATFDALALHLESILHERAPSA
jgi:heme oxygenase